MYPECTGCHQIRGKPILRDNRLEPRKGADTIAQERANTKAREWVDINSHMADGGRSDSILRTGGSTCYTRKQNIE